MMRSICHCVLVLTLLVTGCGSTAAPPRAAGPGERPSATAYPPSFPVLEEGELARRTAAAQAKAPGWEIVLDAMGLLAWASYPTANDSDHTSAEDHAKIDAFLAANGELVGFGAPVRPCVDARTGEDLTRLGGQWLIRTVNGRVVERSFKRR